MGVSCSSGFFFKVDPERTGALRGWFIGKTGDTGETSTTLATRGLGSACDARSFRDARAPQHMRWCFFPTTRAPLHMRCSSFGRKRRFQVEEDADAARAGHGHGYGRASTCSIKILYLELEL